MGTRLYFNISSIDNSHRVSAGQISLSTAYNDCFVRLTEVRAKCKTSVFVSKYLIYNGFSNTYTVSIHRYILFRHVSDQTCNEQYPNGVCFYPPPPNTYYIVLASKKVLYVL